MSEHAVILADVSLPPQLILLPMISKPLFPGIFMPLIVQGRDDLKIIEKSVEVDNFIGLILINQDEPSGQIESEHLFRVGVVAKVIKRINLPDGSQNVFISTLKRFRIRNFLQTKPLLCATVKYLEDDLDDASEDEITALTRSLLSEMKQVVEHNPLFSEEMRLNMVNIDKPGKVADFIASILNIERFKQQQILETLNVKRRMEQVLVHIKREQELLRLQKKIQDQLNEKLEKSQREYFLREQLKVIKQELGMPTDAKHAEYQQFKQQIETLPLNDEVREPVMQELNKFSLMEPHSPEFHVTRNYLDTIASLPWANSERQNIDMRKAIRTLDNDHYGLEDVKERIIEFLAVRVLKRDPRGSIICLVGPPGVGKTSVGRSIARALNKKFFRFSVGGMRDEAEIKGHRRTYIGAMPGKIIQGLKITKTKDPVFMIDEIDKMGISFQGDPSSALLEVLDPEQNNSFRDHYLDLPFDISNILFIVTANTLDPIPRPLLDRMEVIRISGYIDDEKTVIARRYIVPRSLERAGLQKKQVRYTKKALLQIANGYAREAGMRNFEKALDKIHRKLARAIVDGTNTPPFSIDVTHLEQYLGKPYFREEQHRAISHIGMAVGLAWTALGGETLTIEAVSNPGKGGFKLTGHMGEVMQESANIAYTWVRSVSDRFGIEPKWFSTRELHLHIPAGATPKDGPSAGITMASCLLSLATGHKLRQRLAMTGELSLVGAVLPIGGLKEKTIAARRNGMKHIIMPADNHRDLDEIPPHITRGIVFHEAHNMDDVLQWLW